MELTNQVGVAIVWEREIGEMMQLLGWVAVVSGLDFVEDASSDWDTSHCQ